MEKLGKVATTDV